jgi:group I intron endonuclease
MIIYKITNKITGKCYIGQTTQALRERWWKHCNRCPSQSHRSYVYNAIQDYGQDNFTIEEIASATDLETLNLLEETLIKRYNTMSPNGYNLHPGGRGYWRQYKYKWWYRGCWICDAWKWRQY